VSTVVAFVFPDILAPRGGAHLTDQVAITLVIVDIG